MHWEAWRLVQAHHAMGHRVVLASSATRFQVEPMARELAADHVLCTPVEIIDGVVTGRTAGPVLWGEGKARAARALAAEHDLDIGRLASPTPTARRTCRSSRSTGNPVCVDPESALVRVAHERKLADPSLRAAAGHAGAGRRRADGRVLRRDGGAGYAGAAIGLLRRSRKTMVDVTGGVGSDLGLAVAGIDIDIVSGTEHLWSARPCVFVFNHQSKLDTIVVAKLLRSEFTGVAKKEAANVPGFGQFFRLAGVAFIDRSDPAKAREALAPAVRASCATGLSLVMAPEGTRSATPRLGPFKKGAFHIAMQAEVPMVPIVLRNVGELMWRGSQVLRPGRSRSACCRPSTRATGSARRSPTTSRGAGMFLDTLANWPADPDRRPQEVAR